MLTSGSHAYEYTQVYQRDWDSEMHGRHFGTKIMAVHRRAIREIHVGAIVEGIDHFSSYSFGR